MCAGKARLREASRADVQEGSLRRHQIPPAVLRPAQPASRPHLRRAVADCHGLGDDAT